VGKILSVEYLKYKIQNTGASVFKIPKYQILFCEYLKYKIQNSIFKILAKYKILTMQSSVYMYVIIIPYE